MTPFPTIVIDKTTNFTQSPVQQPLGIIDTAYTEFVQARNQQKKLRKSLKSAMNDNANWLSLENRRKSLIEERKLLKLHLLHDNVIIKNLDTEVRSHQNVLEGKRDALSGHLVTYTKKNGPTVKLDGHEFYIKQSAKLEKTK